MEQDQKTIEMLFQELNGILADMNQDEISLEESFALYQNGIQLLKVCNDKIDRVEKQLMILDGSEEW
jgi:exodeoxyribonuclease VII small subunit